jgi:hypothetical protein
MAEKPDSVRFMRLGMKKGHLEAGRELKKRGLDFPSHPLVDGYLMERPRRDGGALELLFRVKELLAYPKKKGVFERGKDIIDRKTGRIIPCSEVPQEAFGEKFIGLYIVPEIVEKDGRVIVHPESVVVRPGVVASFWKGNVGRVEDFTRIPNVPPLWGKREQGNEGRVLHLKGRGGIFGIVRGVTNYFSPVEVYDYVFADIWPGEEKEVVGVVREKQK